MPQGSNLGPLLFCLFVNDLPDHISSSDKLLFADDIKIFHRVDDPTDCLDVQDDLIAVNNWCSDNCLLLNSNKCSVLTVSRKRNTIQFDYSLDGVTLERVDSMLDLGVVFDCELRFDDHVFRICSQASKILGFVLRAAGGFADRDVLVALYSALVRSRLEYASVVWDPLYAVYNSTLESIQRRFLKYLYFRKYREYPPQGYGHTLLLNEFGLPSLSSRRESANLKFLYKLAHHIIDSDYLYNKLQFYTPRPSSRSRYRFYNVAARTNVMVNSPIFRICSQYNKISHLIDIDSSSLSQFVTGLGCIL